MNAPAPLRIDGKFLSAGSRRLFVRMVTYGPFPGGWPAEAGTDFQRLRAIGCDAVRLYQMPGHELLDAAAAAGLWVFAGLQWPWATDFLRGTRVLAAAESALLHGLADWGGHPALAGVFVANEVPPDLARWIGPVRVREAIERLIRVGKRACPDRLFAYGNYPSTEYLEPENADFTACNVYLEDEREFRKYLRRIHHLAGDRPAVISEFGLDSRRNGVDRQAATLAWAIRAARAEDMAGIAIYAWNDRWWNRGEEITDWDFGLTDRNGADKPALASVREAFGECASDIPMAAADVSVIVCTRNGASRIAPCLDAIARMVPPPLETIVVDDGSSDGTGALVASRFPWVKLVTTPSGGLSRARNAGAMAAGGGILAFTDDDCRPDREWVGRLARAFGDGEWGAVGGPNMPPSPGTLDEAVVAAAPGAPSHVLLDDVEAEHLPGCNLAVRRSAFEAVGGFDPVFHTAGDDVDFCWRLRDAGHRLGFSPTAFVWHWRRGTLAAYLRQQWGYGKAEALLIPKHRPRFCRCGGVRWRGFIYAGGPVGVHHGAVIYHGLLGRAGYQSVISRTQPLRPLDARFDTWSARQRLAIARALQPFVRSLARWWFSRWHPAGTATVGRSVSPASAWHGDVCIELRLWSGTGKTRDELLDLLLEHDGWRAAPEDSGWDLQRGDCRLLAATELGDGRGRLTLVRLAGHRPDAPALLAFATRHGWAVYHGLG